MYVFLYIRTEKNNDLQHPLIKESDEWTIWNMKIFYTFAICDLTSISFV